MKIIALDLGDQWTGIAISDALRITGRPFTTVATAHLPSFLQQLFAEQTISTIVAGYPKTLKGTESEQTRKIAALGAALQQQFPTLEWVWWDERLTSKQADALVRPKNKEEKLTSHAVAAALLLRGYLDSLEFNAS
jgi:putative Holliday junction resolvase